MHDNADNLLQVVNFSTRDFKGSIDIDYLSKVIAMPQLSLAPTGPDYVVGLVNLAGTVIPVIDLSMRLNVSQPEKYSINTPILICKTENGQQFGVIVDQVDEIASVSPEMIQNDIADRGRSNLVSGAIKYDEEIALLINVNNLLEHS